MKKILGICAVLMLSFALPTLGSAMESCRGPFGNAIDKWDVHQYAGSRELYPDASLSKLALWQEQYVLSLELLACDRLRTYVIGELGRERNPVLGSSPSRWQVDMYFAGVETLMYATGSVIAPWLERVLPFGIGGKLNISETLPIFVSASVRMGEELQVRKNREVDHQWTLYRLGSPVEPISNRLPFAFAYVWSFEESDLP